MPVIPTCIMTPEQLAKQRGGRQAKIEVAEKRKEDSSAEAVGEEGDSQNKESNQSSESDVKDKQMKLKQSGFACEVPKANLETPAKNSKLIKPGMSDTENHPGRKRVRPMTLTAFFNSIKKPKSDSISKQLEKGCIVRTIPKEPLKTQNQTRSAEDVHHKTDDAARDAKQPEQSWKKIAAIPLDLTAPTEPKVTIVTSKTALLTPVTSRKRKMPGTETANTPGATANASQKPLPKAAPQVLDDRLVLVILEGRASDKARILATYFDTEFHPLLSASYSSKAKVLKRLKEIGQKTKERVWDINPAVRKELHLSEALKERVHQHLERREQQLETARQEKANKPKKKVVETTVAKISSSLLQTPLWKKYSARLNQLMQDEYQKACDGNAATDSQCSLVTTCDVGDEVVGLSFKSTFRELQEIKFLANYLQGRRCSLNELCDSLLEMIRSETGGQTIRDTEKLPFCTALEERIRLTAECKNYGFELETMTDIEKTVLHLVVGSSGIEITTTMAEISCIKVWEVCNLDLLEKHKAKQMLQDRKGRRMLQTHLKHLLGLLCSLYKEVEADLLLRSCAETDTPTKKFEKDVTKAKSKVKLFEDKVLKFMRDEEVRKQKELEKELKRQQRVEAEKELARKREVEKQAKSEAMTPRKPRITLTKFFAKQKSPVKRVVADTEAVSVQGSATVVDEKTPVKTSNPTAAINLPELFNSKLDLRPGDLLSPLLQRLKAKRQSESLSRRRHIQSQLHQLGIEKNREHGELDDVDICRIARKKLFQFFEDLRPPYFGTVEHDLGYTVAGFNRSRLAKKVFVTLNQAQPCTAGHKVNSSHPSQMQREIDYDYDSGLEWEEPEDGESIASEAEKDKENDKNVEDELDYNDGWLAADEEQMNVGAVEGKGQEKTLSKGAPLLKATISDICYDYEKAERDQNPFVAYDTAHAFSMTFFQDTNSAGLSGTTKKAPCTTISRCSEKDVVLEVLPLRERRLLLSSEEQQPTPVTT